MTFQHDILPLKNIIFRTALRIIPNREEAQDIVQDTLLKLWQNRAELDRVSNLESFALIMARNLAIDRKKKMEHRNISFDEALHDRTDEWQLTAQQQMEHQERYGAIRQAIDSLPEKQRTVLHLRDVEGKPYKEIAAIMSLTESDVKVTLFRARNQLKEMLKKSHK